MENWANRKTLILSRSDMIGLLTPAEYNACVEQAYRMHGEGRFYMDPKGHILGWLNELAFAPVDYNPKAEEDEWSGDAGTFVETPI